MSEAKVSKPEGTFPVRGSEAWQTCGVCFEQKRRLKIVACGHEFCDACLEHLVSDAAATATPGPRPGSVPAASCPTCRAPFPLPTSLIGRDRADRDLKDIDKFYSTSYYGLLKCNLCREEKPTKDIWWCNGCDNFICSYCQVDQHGAQRSHGKLFKFTSREALKRAFRTLAPARPESDTPASKRLKVEPDVGESGSTIPDSSSARRFRPDVTAFFERMLEEVMAYTSGGSYAEYREELATALSNAYGKLAESEGHKAKGPKAKTGSDKIQDPDRADKVACSLLELADAPIPKKDVCGKAKLEEDLPFLKADPRAVAYTFLGLSKDEITHRARNSELRRCGTAQLRIPDFKAWAGTAIQDLAQGGKSDRKYSDKEMIRGLEWSMDVQVSGDKYLAVFAICRIPDRGQPEEGRRWSCRAKVTVRIRPQREGAELKERSFVHVFGPGEGKSNSGRGYPRFVQLEEVRAPGAGYLDRDGALQLELVVEAEMPAGLPKRPPSTRRSQERPGIREEERSYRSHSQHQASSGPSHNRAEAPRARHYSGSGPHNPAHSALRRH